LEYTKFIEDKSIKSIVTVGSDEMDANKREEQAQVIEG
jgi:hypothetical protein